MSGIHFDIIIPLYNRAYLVGETLQSLIEQTYPCWHAYVVDDGSSDGSIEVARKYAALADGRITAVSRPDTHHPGGSGARNYGASLGINHWLIFLDSDDLFSSDALNIRAELVSKHQEADMVVFPSAMFRERIGDDDRIWNRLESNKPDLQRFLSFDMPWCISGPVWNRNSFTRLGGFNENALNWQDWEIHVRTLLEGFNIVKAKDASENYHNYIRHFELGNSLSNKRDQIHLIRNRVMIAEGLRPQLASIKHGLRYLHTFYFMENRFVVRWNNDEATQLFRELRDSFPIHYRFWWLFNEAWIALANRELRLLGGLPVPKMINRIYNWTVLRNFWIGKMKRTFWLKR